VQGRLAGADIAAAVAEFAALPDVDVLIVGRGGGSTEDLWAFNEERVARAIAAALVPVVSAVGHEIDVTLADLAADCRVATPTAAAALVVPDCAELQRRVRVREAALVAAWRSDLRRRRERIAALARHVRDPRRHLLDQRRRLTELDGRARRALRDAVRMARARLAGDAERLQALSPLAVLERGYAIVRRDDGQVVRSTQEVQAGDALQVRFRSGSARVRVESVRGDS
jgi:exodeoxyribonuclease VII large subunit